MNELIEHEVYCPYCGENICVLVDASVPDQRYIEDCQVCCRPIIFDVKVQGDGELFVSVSSEDE